MICYKDMTFCSAECKTEDCNRKLTPEDQENAIELGLLIAFSDFSEMCGEYDAK